RIFETSSWSEVGFIGGDDDQSAWPAYSLNFSPDSRLLATGQANATILLWDGSLRGGARGGKIASAEAEALWSDLASSDARRGYAAVWRLTDDPERAIALLGKRLNPAETPRPETIKALITDLDSSDFKVRNGARLNLEALGDLAEPALQ